jgi:hypothetical protein
MTYQEMLEQLCTLEKELLSLGYAVGNSRLGRYKRDIAKLATPAVLQDLLGSFSRTELNQLFFTFAELYELNTIFSTLNLNYQSILMGRLGTVLAGPSSAAEESDSNNSSRARNVQFELFLMAQLLRAGFPLADGTLTDVRTSFNNRAVLIECKRPQRSSGVQAAIRHGVKQLMEQPRNQVPNALKIVAISLSKVLTEGDKLLRIEDETIANSAVDEAIYSEIVPHLNYFRRRAGAQVTGILVYASASGIRTRAMSPATFMRQLFFDNPHVSKADYTDTENWFNTYERGGT